jgi:hypothetical protein
MSRNGTTLKIKLPDGRQQTCAGREAWALRHLVNAGRAGFTTLKQLAPQWSHHIYKLRKTGLGISTDSGAHSGDFPGNHGRYQLETAVTLIEGGGQ